MFLWMESRFDEWADYNGIHFLAFMGSHIFGSFWCTKILASRDSQTGRLV